MNFVKKIASKKSFSVLDFGAETVIALFAEKKKDGTFRVLGGGEAPSRGLQDGELSHIGDAVESVVEALKKAERSSGSKTETLYFNFDDPQMESVHVRGSKNLIGEGQIKKEDVEEAENMAGRYVGHFDKMPVYSRQTGFLIDDRDPVMNPLGVFGRKLEVEMHILLARSEYYERWDKVFERVPVARRIPVLSSWSTAYGVIPAAVERNKKRLIWDLGKDLLSGFIFDHNRIREYCVFRAQESRAGMAERVAEASRQLLNKAPGTIEILLTGDLVQDDSVGKVLKEDHSVPARVASPAGIDANLCKSAYAALVGLLSVAEELERRSHATPHGRELLVHLKGRASSFLGDYF